MTIPHPDDPEIDPDKTEESPQPDRDNDEDEHGIADRQ